MTSLIRGRKSPVIWTEEFAESKDGNANCICLSGVPAAADLAPYWRLANEIVAWLGSLPQNSLEEPIRLNQHMISKRPSGAATLISPSLLTSLAGDDIQRTMWPGSLFVPREKDGYRCI